MSDTPNHDHDVIAPIPRGWTIGPDGRANTSPEFLRLCAEVERLIRSDAHMLINGRADRTAGLIMAQLAHIHGFAPPAGSEEKGLRTKLAAADQCGYERAIEVLRDRHLEYARVAGASDCGCADHLAAVASSLVKGDSDER